MKNSKSILMGIAVLLLTVGMLVVTGCPASEPADDDGDDDGTAVADAQYACEMHPDETSAEAGAKCGECGMDLVAVDDDGGGQDDDGDGDDDDDGDEEEENGDDDGDAGGHGPDDGHGH